MNKNDFPTYEENEEQVRRDMQALHDESREAFNALVDALGASAAAAELGAVAPTGLTGHTVQALINELAASIGALGGSLEVDGETIASLVAAAMEGDVLSAYYTAEQVESKLGGLGVAALEERLENVESALAQDGVVVGEVARHHGFILPGSEMAGVGAVMDTQRDNRVLLGEELISLVAGSGSMVLKRVNVLSGVVTDIPVNGQSLPLNEDSKNFTPLWVDDAGAYMLIKAGSAWYLLSLTSGLCSLLVSGSGYAYCGAARLGNIVTAVFASGGLLYFYRRNIAGDNGAAPAITALDSYSESGDSRDRVLNVYGSEFFVMLKYGSGDSKLKLYSPGDMSCSAEFSTGLAGAYAAGGIRRRGTDAYFLLASGGSYKQCRCLITVTGGAAAPSLVSGGDTASGSRVIARGEGVVYALAGRQLSTLDAVTMEQSASVELPANVDSALCNMEGSALGELWGGKYVPTDYCMLDMTDMSSRRLRCGLGSPEGCAVQPVAGRYFAAHAGGEWYAFDSLLRPVWGMAPYVTAGAGSAEALPEVDTSGFGAMTKV